MRQPTQGLKPRSGVRENRRRDAGATELSLDVLAGCLHHSRIITEITHAAARAAGAGRRGTHHGHGDDYSSSLPQFH